LAQFIEFVIKGNPRAGHLWVDFTESTFADPSTGTVAHEFRALGFERAIRDRGSLVHPSDMFFAVLISRIKDSYRHKFSLNQNASSNHVYSLLI
jgi:hypothetical protein